ncbi:MAG: site-specific integrase, partial [Acidobacteria bacterium]|nr:site-specific integrase [Acidobacteriota bacterium]
FARSLLTADEKRCLFRVAASKPEWEVAFCAAVIAVNTTCRKVEVLNLRWADVDLFARVLTINRSKTEAGRRAIPLNAEAMAALGKLRARSEAHGGGGPEHFVFPACENGIIEVGKPQAGFRTAWRSLVKAAARRAGDAAADGMTGPDAENARKRAERAFLGFRFHDLRHQAVTELAEAGVTDAAMQSIAGHLSKKMLDHYSHVRMTAKRQAVETLGGGLIDTPEHAQRRAGGKVN